MKMSQNGIKFLKELEGSKKEMYLDSAGLLTIGVGHLLTKDELASGKIIINNAPIKYANSLTDDQVRSLLDYDVSQYVYEIGEWVRVQLNQNQFDALVCFCFNIGLHAFFSSTLRKELNKGNYDEVPHQMERWNRSGGKVVQGLINRRKKEIELWNREADK